MNTEKDTDKQNKQKSHWSERARAGARNVAEFMSQHGTNIGIAGGTVLMAMGATSEGMSLAYAQEAGPVANAMATTLREGAVALVTAGALKMGAFAGAEVAAKKFLDIKDNYFDDSAYRKAAYGLDGDPIHVDPRSSAPIETVSDEDIMDDQLKEAVVDVFFESSGDNPKLTEHAAAMLKSSSQVVRDALFRAQQEVKQNGQASSVEHVDYSNVELPGPDSDDAPGL